MGKLRRKMTDVTVMLGPRIWRQKSLGDIWERVWTSAVEALNSSPRGQIWGTKDQPNLEGREEELFFVGNQFSSVQFSSVQSFSRVWLWPHGLQHTRLPCPSPTPKAYSNSHPSSQWYHLTISSSVIPFSSHLQYFPESGSFSNESVLCIRWPKCWSFSFNSSLSHEYSGLIFIRIDWLDLLADQGTLKSILQYHSSKAPILWCSAFFMVRLSHPYMTTGVTSVLTTTLSAK